jgi:hypothetical protein
VALIVNVASAVSDHGTADRGHRPAADRCAKGCARTSADHLSLRGTSRNSYE